MTEFFLFVLVLGSRLVHFLFSPTCNASSAAMKKQRIAITTIAMQISETTTLTTGCVRVIATLKRQTTRAIRRETPMRIRGDL